MNTNEIEFNKHTKVKYLQWLQGTHKARQLQFQLEGGHKVNIWLPASQINFNNDLTKVFIPEYLAKEKGLI